MKNNGKTKRKKIDEKMKIKRNKKRKKRMKRWKNKRIDNKRI